MYKSIHHVSLSSKWKNIKIYKRIVGNIQIDQIP